MGASVLSGKTSAINNNKTDAKVSSIVGTVKNDGELLNKNFSKNRNFIIGAGIGVSALAAILILYGVGCHINKKFLESAITFLDSNPCIINAVKENVSVENDDFKQFFKRILAMSVKILILFKDGKIDEVRKSDSEVSIRDDTITLRFKKKVKNSKFSKFVISKSDDKIWDFKVYVFDKGVEKLSIKVTLGPEVSEQSGQSDGQKIQDKNDQEAKNIEWQAMIYCLEDYLKAD